MGKFWYAVSLGSNCETKFQLARSYGRQFAPSGIFDWQVTPAAALIEYFERDFVGMFERDQLTVGPYGVTNAKYNTIHMHEFSDGAGSDAIATEYPKARARHDYLCEKMRRLLASDRRLLLVLRQEGLDQPIDTVRSIIRKRHSRLSFETLIVAHTTGPSDPKEPWQGDNDAWDAALFRRRPEARAFRTAFGRFVDGLGRNGPSAPLLPLFDFLPTRGHP